jgi:prepilin-type N-terminal cleavage/methylation domain-containing protein
MKKGFSIIELLIVLGIIVLVSIIIFPAISKFKDTQTLKTSVEDVSSLIAKARVQTISGNEGRAFGVTIDASTKTFTLYALSGGTKITRETTTLPSQIAVSTTTTDIQFEKVTGEAVSSGTITLTNQSGLTRTITVSGIGTITAN